jgi:cysteine-rich repeat protein
MAMRGILIAVACAVVVGGCGCSERKLLGRTDADVDAHADDDIDHRSPGTCGNGIVEGTEECDDGDGDDCNGCSNACKWERSLSLDGATNAAIIWTDGDLCLPGEFTVEWWFQITRFRADNCYFMHQSPAFRFYMTDEGGRGRLMYGLCMDPPDGCEGGGWELDYELGTWHHVALTYGLDEERGNWMLTPYIDGTRSTGIIISGPYAWPCSSPVYLLSDSYDGGGGGPCMAIVDEMRISETAIYSADFVPPRSLSPGPNTVALWSFNIEVDGMIPDVSHHGHDAMLDDGLLVPDECHLP